MKQMLLALALSLVGGLAAADDAAKLEFFESKIRPMLIKHCYECHSAESKEIKGNLRVDSAAGLLKGGDSGPAIVPGKPDESPLIEALRYDGFEMPPAGRLAGKIVQDFERWVADGAVDPRNETPAAGAITPQKVVDIEAGRQFWAFQPLAAPKAELPAERVIDARVDQRLSEAGLKPMPAADTRTLVRRLYFDLIGLPPSLKEDGGKLIDELLGIEIGPASGTLDRDALASLVDRLLDSPQFGVHWGRHWLDVARYADSNGGDFNATFHNAWRYRDYVIDAYNHDKPFDEFVREQIAGDLMDSSSDDQRAQRIVATGFLMLGAKMLSERDKEKLTMDVVDEQINTVGQAFMGMTLGCARCHDHKFDPIPTADYYALAGIFRSTRTLEGESQQYVSTWPRRELPAEPEHVAAMQEHTAAKRQLEDAIKQAKQRQDELAKQIDANRQRYQALTVDDTEAKLTGVWKSSTYSQGYVGKGYLHDDNAEKGEKWVEYSIPVPKNASYDVQLSYTPGSGRANNVPVSVQHADGEIEIMWNQQPKPPIDGIFTSVGKFAFTTERPAVITIATRGTDGHVIADAVRMVELDQNGQPVPVTTEVQSEEMAEAKLEFEQVKTSLEKLANELKELEANAPPPLPKAIAVAEAKQIGDCEICIRGEHRNRGRLVPRGVLQVASIGPPPQIDQTTSGRLQLANWLANADHPLTARVYVNRIWHHLLGRGIVASVDNFGKLGDRPTHPLLLDQLAADFVRDGWSTKKTIRRIVMSDVYRRSSDHDEHAWSTDPENKLLWRANRRRLPAEAIRDSILAISGEIDLSPAGSPVPGLGTLVTQNNAEQQKFQKKESVHRSAYLPIIRAEIPPILAVFDFADPDLVTGRRAVTNVPAQALLLLNSPFVMEQAELAADRVAADAKSDAAVDLVDAVYKRVLCRPPAESELARAVAFLKSADTHADTSPQPLTRLIHTLFASTEFRMLN